MNLITIIVKINQYIKKICINYVDNLINLIFFSFFFFKNYINYTNSPLIKY